MSRRTSPATSPEDAAATRFAATVSYHGAGFRGSQLQPRSRTVQGELERAAEALFGQPVRVELAGRTDTGVHALGQVAAFNAVTRLDAATTGRALNAHLDEDVSVRDVRVVGSGFDPRRHAVRRRYRYSILNTPVRMPLPRGTTWHVAGDLDVQAMREAADALVGEQDFRACSGPLEAGKTSVRTVFSAEWSNEGELLAFEIEANAFLPRMVRRITGALVEVGRGNSAVDTFTGRLRSAEVGAVGPTAPAQGLCLQRIWYHEEYPV